MYRLGWFDTWLAEHITFVCHFPLLYREIPLHTPLFYTLGPSCGSSSFALIVCFGLYISYCVSMSLNICGHMLQIMSSSIELQKQIKDNAEDVRRFVSDLSQWEEEMKHKEAETRTTSGSSKESVSLKRLLKR